jgi:hypothetical protein
LRAPSSSYAIRNVTGNTIQRNRGSIIVQYDGIYGSGAQFSNNVLRDNELTSSTSGILSINGMLSGRYNIFDNQANTYQLILVNAWNTGALSFDRNWWGTNVEEEVASTILDFYEDSLRSTVNYLPYLMEPAINGNISSENTTLQFLSYNTFLKGDVDQNYTLAAGSGPYNLTGTLFVPEGRRLTIESGITFYCYPSSGITLTPKTISNT